ncbi:MAG: beta-ketoacyl-ACP synthase II [Ardenticatenaceae bacterium]|nr:beta-ketoacyl-ACP synthase II [Anaerolineales bacterium]MCB8938561.1 beta-ketoacyl-ACP synthase II [Ardenticatenaceae bacterium]MCB8973694.1 beta-ketoacyl-ACP synthase II [Ardenticatenaceae bacterium]
MNQQKRRVVVTGLGTINPLGNDVPTTWQKIRQGESGIDTLTAFDASEYKTTFAGEVKKFDPQDYFDRKEVRRMSRMTQFALFAAQQAIEDARLTVTAENKNRIGVVVGSGMGSMDPIIDNVNMINERGPYRVSPFFVPMMLADTPAATVSIQHGLGGPNMSVATACATGNDAIGQAARVVQYGAADVMVAGGSEACLLPVAFAGFSVMKAMSTRNESPQTASRPFDQTRDGFVVSEGAAIVVLEELEHALARGAHIYGEFMGYGASADAYHISMPAEDGSGAIEAMRAALADAAVEPAAVNYISAHGTSTPLNDKAETAAIKQLFGEAAYNVAVSSTKSMHGHLLGASGSLEAIICLKAIGDNLLPPTINYENPDPECDLDYVPNVARPAQVDVTMSNGFGLGGHNATLVLGRYGR